MKITDEHYTYVMPSYWIPYYVNSDPTGYTDEEIAEMDAADEKMRKAHPNLFLIDYTSDEESYFSMHNDFNNLGGDVVRVAVIERVTE